MFINNFLDGVKRVFSWLPIIWRDRDYDQSYLYEIMRHKLRSMEKFFSGDFAFAANADKAAREIHHAIWLLDRIIAEDYYDDAFRFHRKKWGEPIHEIVYGQWHVTYPNATTEEEYEQARKEAMTALKNAEKSKINDVRYLMHLLGKHSLGWWD